MNIKTKAVLSCLTFLSFGATGCSSSPRIVIYTSLEDYRISYLEKRLKEELPQQDVVVQYLDTGTLVSRLQSEGVATDCDIVIGLEATNAEMLLSKNSNIFEGLSAYDSSIFLDELMTYPSALKNDPKYHIFDKEAGSIILNKKVLAERGLDTPKSFDDLLDEKYKNLIIMPNPKTSGTGYYFYSGLVSVWGEDKALSYFSALSKNAKEFSTSGSGPVKALDRDEIAIGFGMTFQAANYALKNGNLEIIYFEEGSPYTLYTNAVINGRFEKNGVKEVYDFVFNKFAKEDKAKFDPETIYKPEYQPTCEIKNYPTDVKYMDMKGIFDPEYKSALLDKWSF